MRRRPLLLLAPLLALSATSDVDAAKPTRRDACEGATIWTSSSTELPLAIVRDGAIARPRGECERGYWNAGGRFTSVDSSGHPVGIATRVEEPGFAGLRRVKGRDGAGLFAFGETWKGATNGVTFEADRELRRAFDAFYVHLAKQHPTSVTWFSAKPKTPGAPTTYAAASGRALVVAYLDDHDRWQLAHLAKQKAPTSKEPFHVRAVFDMNGDGRPEIVAHLREDEPGYDVVLSPSRNGRHYRKVAENPDDGP